MSLSSAHKSIALVCKVLDLPVAQNCGKESWSIWVNEIAIAVNYCAKSDALHISHQLTSLIQFQPTSSDFDVVKKFTDCYLNRQTHWIEIDCKSKSIALHSQINLADENDVVLSIEIPFFAQLCSWWRLFVQRKMPDSFNSKERKTYMGACSVNRHLVPSTLALCESQDIS